MLVMSYVQQKQNYRFSPFYQDLSCLVILGQRYEGNRKKSTY